MSDVSQHALLRVVEEQRAKLLNVLGIVQCIKVVVLAGRVADVREFDGVVESVEEGIQVVLAGLEGVSLLGRTEETAGSVALLKRAS